MHLVLYPDMPETPEQSAEIAIRIAGLLNLRVDFDFNGVVVSVYGSDTAEEAADAFREAFREHKTRAIAGLKKVQELQRENPVLLKTLMLRVANQPERIGS